MDLTEIEKELIHTLKEFEIDKASVIGVVLSLDTDEQAIDLMEWLVENPYATQVEILTQVEVINPEPLRTEYDN